MACIPSRGEARFLSAQLSDGLISVNISFGPHRHKRPPGRLIPALPPPSRDARQPRSPPQPLRPGPRAQHPSARAAPTCQRAAMAPTRSPAARRRGRASARRRRRSSACWPSGGAAGSSTASRRPCSATRRRVLLLAREFRDAGAGVWRRGVTAVLGSVYAAGGGDGGD